MMTQQYPFLKYITYLVIFFFHIVILFLLYNYSTKSFISNLGWDGSPKQELHEYNENLNERTADPIVSVQHDIVTAPITTKEKSEAAFTEKQFISPSQAKPTSRLQSDKKNVIDITSSKHTDNEFDAYIPSAYQVIAEPMAKRSISLESTEKIDNSTHSIPLNEPAKGSNTDKINIPPAAFFQAFKDSYYQEQASLGNIQHTKINSTNSKNSESESLISQRLGELKISDYIQQIKKAFYEAARRTPGMYLNSEKELKTDLDVKLEIQSHGGIKVLKFQSSGVSEIDTYINKFLQDIIVHPIPKRYNVNALPFSTKILINIDKNTRFYTLRCFF